MGRQLNFWMTQSDESAFVDRLIQDDAVWTQRALPYREEPVMRELSQWTPLDGGQRLIVIRQPDWELLEWTHIPKSEFPDDPEFKEWTMVGSGPSPAFEWDTCLRGPGYIVRGRIYFRTDWLVGNQIYVKPEEPTRWFDRLTGWLRRRGLQTEYSRQFIMPDAAASANAGAVEIKYQA